MCGIVGYTGKQKTEEILLNGLKALEYRGYDSAGLFIARSGVIKSVGAVDNLRRKVSKRHSETTVGQSVGFAGIAHTRWATHGVPSERNAHPHSDCSQKVWLVHNGIIENYRALTEELIHAGHVFHSDTDSEVLAHLIEEYLKKTDVFEKAVIAALKRVSGTYGIAVMHTDEPEKIITARMGSPIVLGIGEDEHIIASDPVAILRHTRNVIYLEDGEVAVVTPSTYRICTLDHTDLSRVPEEISWDVTEAERGGHPHFMLKEIMEGPDVLENSARGRLVFDDGTAKLGGLMDVAEKLKKIRRIIIVGCGSAYYAGLVGKYMLEEYAGISVEAEIGSEFRYRKMVFDTETAILAISQSGETADTLASVKEAKRKGLLTLGIVNTVGSTIARESDAGVYNHAGPEIGVASTKAFISQLEVLALLTLTIGRTRGMSLEEGVRLVKELHTLPQKVRQILNSHNYVREIAKKYSSYDNFLYIGRKYNFPISYEGALKLKEVSYIHAEGYGAGEMKHGPIAMIDEQFPTVAIVPKDSVYEKTISNIEEIRARRGPVLAIATEGDFGIRRIVDDVIYIPAISEMLSPILSVVPLQLFAYYFGVARKYNVDKPRNLAKSVTVE